MRARTIRIVFFLLAGLILPAGDQLISAQTPAGTGQKTIGRDEVFFSVARRIRQVSESPVSAIVSELDGLVEVTAISADPDGRALVTFRERTPASAAYPVKSTRMRFAPPPAGGKEWTWVEFEENRKFYPIDKLFPYVKDELGRRRQATVARWSALLAAVGKQNDAAIKAAETIKGVIRVDPPILASLMTLRTTLAEAVKEDEKERILSVYREILQQAEAVTTLSDTYSDLKANDAFLRLIDEYKNSINQTTTAQKDYVQSIAAYNESLLRLPFTLVAYGLGFTRLEAALSAE